MKVARGVLLLLLALGCRKAETRVLRSAATDLTPVLIGAGDVADCTTDGREQTARILDTIDGTVFVAGDAAYRRKNVPDPLHECYDATWGRHKSRTRPAPGNHEYDTGNAQMYFSYFGAAAGPPDGYYSYEIGTWHVIALNTTIAIGRESEQLSWLRRDLDAHAGHCTVAYMHHPRFSSGPHDERERLIPLWEELQDYGVTIAVAGHDHIYERFAPLDAQGNTDAANGVRQFVVGTGGAHRYDVQAPLFGSEARSTTDFGVLKLTLLPDRYRWEFIPVDQHGFHDRGEASCRPTRAVAR